MNTTIILTTHDMSDIEALAKRIILIGKGRILYDGNIKKLKENGINVTVRREFGGNIKAACGQLRSESD